MKNTHLELSNLIGQIESAMVQALVMHSVLLSKDYSYTCQGQQIQELWEGGGGLAEFSSKRRGGGGVQPLTQEQFVLQIYKIFSKKRGGVRTPLDLPLLASTSVLAGARPCSVFGAPSELPYTKVGYLKSPLSKSHSCNLCHTGDCPETG